MKRRHICRSTRSSYKNGDRKGRGLGGSGLAFVLSAIANRISMTSCEQASP